MICMCIYLCIHVYWRMFTKFTPTMTRGLIWASKMNGSCEPRFLCEMPSLTLPTTEEKGIENRNATFQVYSTSRVLRGHWRFTPSWLCCNDLAGQTADFLLSTRTFSFCFFRCVFIAWLWLITSLVSDFFKGILLVLLHLCWSEVSLWQIPSHFMHAQSMVIDWRG